EAGQIAQIDVADEHDVAAVAAVAAVRPALRHVLLAPERQAAVAAAPGLGVDVRSVGEERAPPRLAIAFALGLGHAVTVASVSLPQVTSCHKRTGGAAPASGASSGATGAKRR